LPDVAIEKTQPSWDNFNKETSTVKNSLQEYVKFEQEPHPKKPLFVSKILGRK